MAGRVDTVTVTTTDRSETMSTEMSRRFAQDKDFLTNLGVDAGDAMQAAWDSESRQSPYSTVADPSDETCEACGDDGTGRGCEDCTSKDGFDEYTLELHAS